jgi:TnpA family transposase
MPRRTILNPTDCKGLFGLPESPDDMIRCYSFSEADISMIRQRRGDHNRIGFAVQLCYLRYPGIAMPADAKPPESLLILIGQQLFIDSRAWKAYAERPVTRLEHLMELQTWMKLTRFTIADMRHMVDQLVGLAQQTDRGIVLAEELIGMLRQQRIVIPSVDVIERIINEVLIRGTRQVYKALTRPLTTHHRRKLDRLGSVKLIV